MNVFRQWLNEYKLAVGAVVVTLIVGFCGIFLITYHEPSGAERAKLYATMTTCGSLPVTQFADAEAEVNIRWKDGIMEYNLDLKDQSGAMAKWIAEHPNGDFLIDWQNAGEKPIGKVTIPFRNFTGNRTSMKGSAQTPCGESLYNKFYKRSAYWGLSWNTHDRK